jgi:hypothetical protein
MRGVKGSPPGLTRDSRPSTRNSRSAIGEFQHGPFIAQRGHNRLLQLTFVATVDFFRLPIEV